MIYTVTFNPSLDYFVTVNDFQVGIANKTTSELILPGGKGLNVSVVLKNLGIDNTAVFFKAGFIGDEIEKRIKDIGITTECIPVRCGSSRINLKLRSIDGTEINGMGPDITADNIEELMIRLDKTEAGDTLVRAGSIPDSVPDTIYSDIMSRLERKGVRIIVDATGSLLVNVLKYKPFLIKPNNFELGDIFGVELRTRESVLPYAKRLQEMGARNVIVSLAGEGGVLIDEKGNTYMSEAPKGKLVNSVGAGDSMVAGFIAGYLEKQDMEYAFKMGLSAGSASAFSEFLATKEEVEKIYRSL
ncbi:MAG: 1-phosphofructokinase [Lachnospiraceae bacterium]|nr:1-phosphofructokinase [Lachnospiraceae bacterium]